MRKMLVNLIRLEKNPGLLAVCAVFARTRLLALVVGLVLAVFDFVLVLVLVLALTLALDVVFVFERD